MNVARIGAAAPSDSVQDKRERLLHKVRDITADRLDEAVRLMMDRVDDALFELAERSESNTLQRTYFDAMREIRLKRAELEQQYRHELLEAVTAKSAPPKPDAGTATVLSLEQMSLVAEDDFEEDIAVGNMVSKLSGTCQELLFALNKRIGYLVARADLDNDSNPFGPRTICEAMRKACAPIDSGIEVRLLLLKLFDRYVVNNTPAIYQEINQYLIDHKVLPDLKPSVGQRRFAAGRPGAAATTRAGAGASSEAAGGGAESSMLGLLQQLMATGTAGAAGAGSPAGGGAPLAGAINTLTLLQQADSGALAGSGLALDAEALRAGTTNVLRPLAGSGVLQELDASKRMTVDIVAMLFDCMLDDPALPEAIKSLIGRLQIPMVKVALLDPDFFARKSHPARRLLNTIAEAASAHAADPDAVQLLREHVAALVERVVAEFEDDLGLFSQLVEALERFVTADLPARLARSERAAKVAQGRERVEQAKIFARNAVEKCVTRHGHHELVYNFLLNHWKTLLIMGYVEFGEDSAELQESLRTMDELAWSVGKARTAADAAKLNALLPGLLKRLRRGLEAVSAPPSARQRFFDKLAACHADRVRAGRNAPAGAPASAASAAEVQGRASAAPGEAADRRRADALRAACEQAAAPAVEDPNDRTLPEEPAGAEPITAASASAPEPAATPGAGDPTDCTLPQAQADPDLVDTIPNPESETAARLRAAREACRETGTPAVEDPNDRTLPEAEMAPDADAEAKVGEIGEDDALPALDTPLDAEAGAPEPPQGDLASLLAQRLESDGAVCVADLLARGGAQPPAEPEPIEVDFEEPAPAARQVDFSALLEAEHDGRSIDALLAGGQLDVEEITMGGPEDQSAGDGDELDEVVARLTKGAKLRFTGEDGAPVHGTLAWVNEVTGTYVFAGAGGRQIATRTRKGLVLDLRRGTAEILAEKPEQPLLERAFGRLLDGLGSPGE